MIKGFVAGLLVSVMICGTAASAAPVAKVAPWFFGIGYQRASFPGADMDALGILGGYNFNRYIGIEIGSEVGKVSGVRLTDGYAELIGRIPLTQNFSFFGTIGAAYAQADAAVRFGSVTLTASQSGSGYRAGAGADWWLSSHWGLRAAYHHQDALSKADGLSVDLLVRF